ncbi:hypothetical protein PIB30_064353 [Stylosanthes scabra]|uniref:Glycerol-3-phosphate dehydrogenase NAD-dependent N-terminal domain-containing protein n=1 Tax=Stylosanthes scabra TaxID=79078 RepID=A0ABU6SMP0_9FABA|nr:hypothetical protein [Stylosanthes scabra]
MGARKLSFLLCVFGFYYSRFVVESNLKLIKLQALMRFPTQISEYTTSLVVNNHRHLYSQPCALSLSFKSNKNQIKMNHTENSNGSILNVNGGGFELKLDELRRLMGKVDGDPLRIVGVGAGDWGSVFTTMLQEAYGP